ncbi:MAG: DUF1800 family protein [Acidobacteria bacterium]|nr:DUF1800 family protein [Acidobacteriota bacterium]
MKFLKVMRFRSLSVIFCVMGLALALALPFAAQQQRPVSPIAPLKPLLPDGALAAGEKLIRLPPGSVSRNTRSRRATKSQPPLTEDQKVLHLLNRAGFGPRPGDIERVRQIGIERYIDEQLHPEDLPDDFLSRPLLALNTLQMSIPETVQFFVSPAVRPTPRPNITPIPTPSTSTKSLPALTPNSGEPSKDEPGKGDMTAPRKPGDPVQDPGSMPQQQSTPSPTQTEPPPQPAAQQMPAPTPTPRRDPQQPLRELQQARILRAVFSEKQLQEVMVDFWFNHFNVFAGKDAVRWMVTSYERDVIRPHAVGKFKELLLAVAQSPAMLYYLDNFMSQAEAPVRNDGATGRRGDGATGNAVSQSPSLPLPQTPPARRSGLNENYARELMELHTLGVDGGYTQEDVIEVARSFTGWSITQQPNSTFVFRPRMHDRGEKFVLGTRIPANGGIEDGLRVLDLLSRHQSTAKFIARKLCQRFVADDPPASLVDRVAEVFRRTDGEIREVVRAILTSTEFYSPTYYRNKIKSPLELVVSAIRATGASTDAASPLIQWTARMGEPLYLCQPPTGYPEDSSRWLSNATLLERVNFALALISNKITGTRVDVSRFVAANVVNNKDRLLDQLIAVLVHSDVSEETRDNLENVVNESREKTNPAKNDERAAQKNNEQLIGGVAALILGSHEFQVK